MKRKLFHRQKTIDDPAAGWLAVNKAGTGLHVMIPWLWGAVGLELGFRPLRCHYLSEWREFNFYQRPVEVPRGRPVVMFEDFDGTPVELADLNKTFASS
jgi:hypothetical protein